MLILVIIRKFKEMCWETKKKTEVYLHFHCSAIGFHVCNWTFFKSAILKGCVIFQPNYVPLDVEPFFKCNLILPAWMNRWLLEKYSKITKREGGKVVGLDEAFSCDSTSCATCLLCDIKWNAEFDKELWPHLFGDGQCRAGVPKEDYRRQMASSSGVRHFNMSSHCLSSGYTWSIHFLPAVLGELSKSSCISNVSGSATVPLCTRWLQLRSQSRHVRLFN